MPPASSQADHTGRVIATCSRNRLSWRWNLGRLVPPIRRGPAGRPWSRSPYISRPAPVAPERPLSVMTPRPDLRSAGAKRVKQMFKKTKSVTPDLVSGEPAAQRRRRCQHQSTSGLQAASPSLRLSPCRGSADFRDRSRQRPETYTHLSVARRRSMFLPLRSDVFMRCSSQIFADTLLPPMAALCTLLLPFARSMRNSGSENK